VLVPVIERDEPGVLFTQRTIRLADHGGQISFPGGKIDSNDASPAAVALREAEEEIALFPGALSTRLAISTFT
jgi:8-oxo-dGTP pyrophosphatase MutT (NUDIX family)